MVTFGYGTILIPIGLTLMITAQLYTVPEKLFMSLGVACVLLGFLCLWIGERGIKKQSDKIDKLIERIDTLVDTIEKKK